MEIKSIRFNCIVVAILIIIAPITLLAQSNLSVVVNLAMLDGVELSSSNIFNYSIVNNENTNKRVTITGSVIYKNTPLRFSYSFNTTLIPGNNLMASKTGTGIIWNFSENALKELFFNYQKLPQGTYEYCVEIVEQKINPEYKTGEPVGSCVYHTIDDMFLINLVSPENDAKIQEYYPLLSWMVNYPFANELKYKIRLVELKKGQNNEQAIVRNNAIYHEKNILSTTIVYPTTAKPLKVYTPYVWTVDAYYKNILLGGAEVWKFTIIEDSLFTPDPYNNSYIDITREHGNLPFTAVGELKLKFVLNHAARDTFQMQLINEKNKEVKLKNNLWALQYDDNRLVLNFLNGPYLSHMKKYRLIITTKSGKQYKVAFTYFNPELFEQK